MIIAESTLFEYPHSISNFAIGETVSMKAPKFYGGIPNLYEISPELEKDLKFNIVTGEISGITETSTGGISKPYTVNAISSNGSLLGITTIYMEIVDSNLPYNVRFFKNAEIVKTSEIKMVKGEHVLVRTENEGIVTEFELLSQNIEGFEINSKTGEYSGICYNEFFQE